jgi:hypothetical protein
MELYAPLSRAASETTSKTDGVHVFPGASGAKQPQGSFVFFSLKRHGHRQGQASHEVETLSDLLSGMHLAIVRKHR